LAQRGRQAHQITDHPGAGVHRRWAAFVWTVVMPVYVAWTIWSWTIARIGVARSTLFMYLVPIVGGLTSWLLLGEGFGAVKIAGSAVTLAGLAVARRTDPAKPIPRPERGPWTERNGPSRARTPEAGQTPTPSWPISDCRS